MMLKRFFLFFLVCSATSALAQETIQLKGKISADSLQGASINIINLSKFTGTNNAPDGTFQIEVSQNDTLFFSSVQFIKQEVVITPQIYQKKYLEVWLEENVNELAEVTIKNTELTGNLKEDIKKIKIYDLPVNFNGKNTQDMKFESDWHDPLSRPNNIALDKMPQTGVNFLGVFGLVADLIDPGNNYKEPVIPKIPMGEMDIALRKIFDEEFFTKTLHISSTFVNDFIFYCADHGLDEKMLQPSKRLDLVEFLMDQSKNYIALNDEHEQQEK